MSVVETIVPFRSGMDSKQFDGNPVFKKRARSGSSKARKRTRTALEPTAEEDIARAQLLVSSLRQESKARKSTWTRDEFSVRGKASGKDQNATAARVDVGGERSITQKTKKAFGPLRAPTHIRTSVRVDYQPDVCKDYKETGYCGFGDSCKFLHDRSDYKAGWQLDRDWAATEKERREKVLRGEDPDDVPHKADDEDGNDEDGLPFACFICRGQFKRPVVTLCEHYFCEDCAVTRMEKDSTCAVCKAQLRGTLNAAPKLVAKLKLRADMDRLPGDKGRREGPISSP